MKLIMNADDFGFSKGVNMAILEAFYRGTLTSTSLMVNMPGFEHAVELMKQHPVLNVGIHLVTSVEYSITKGLKTITDENGKFIHNNDAIKNASLDELKQEYEAQLLKFLDTGFTPTHIDFHWCYHPVQVEAAMYLSKKYNIPVRSDSKEVEEVLTKNNITSNKNMMGDFYNTDPSQITPQSLIDVIQKCLDGKDDQYAIMFHPAYVDNDVLTLSSYNVHRAKEFYVLMHDDVLNFFKNHPEIELISFKDL